MMKKIVLLVLLSLSCNSFVFSAVGVDSGDRIFNRHTPSDPNDHSALNASLIMVIQDGILNGSYHIKPMKVWSSEYSLLISTAEQFETAGAVDTSKVYMYDGTSWVLTNYIISTTRFDVGEVLISSQTFPAFAGLYDTFRTSATIARCRIYCEVTSSVTTDQTQIDICYSSSTTGASSSRIWSSIFSSTTPWVGANSLKSNWFVPDITNMGVDWTIAPRILSIPLSGTLPVIRIEVQYIRRINE